MTRARAVDVGIVVVGAALTATHAWSDPIPGPRWLVAVLPLLVNLPMLWRRSHPLLAWALVMGGIDLQAVVSGYSAEGTEYIYAFGVGAYSVAAYADRPRALAGLVVGLAAYGLYALNDHDIESGAGDALWA